MNNWGLDVYSNNQLDAAYVYAYLEVTKNSDLKILEANLSKEIFKLKSATKQTESFSLQPLTNIHLYSDLDHEISETGQGNNFWILGSVALLILILGWVNHFNLFTASSLDQLESLSIRKIIGANRKHLFNQLLAASSFTSSCGLMTGIILVEILEPIIANYFQIPFQDFSLFELNFSNPAFYLLSLLVAGSILIGIFPAIFLSRINPVHLLSKKLLISTSGNNFQKWLVAFQFTIIITLLICTGTVFKQTKFMQEQDLGMSLNNIIAVRGPLGIRSEAMLTSFPIFQNRIMSLPGVERMSRSHDIPGNQLEMIQDLRLGEKSFSIRFLSQLWEHRLF